ncbi:MAG: hypothetical protein ACRDBI_05615 [Shewanella sp.]
MHHTLGRYFLVIFTLLAVAGQSVMANGHAMVPLGMLGMEIAAHTEVAAHTSAAPAPAMSTQAPTPHQGMEHAAASMNSKHHKSPSDAHAMTDSNCCGDSAPSGKQHCCDGTNSCTKDCGHCLTISVTGTLFSPHLWPSVSLSDTAMATPMSHFHSISLSSALKPPIA